MPTEDPMACAARWFINLIMAPDVNELWPQFEEWLQRDLGNRSAYEEMERTWSALYPVARHSVAEKGHSRVALDLPRHRG
jgi:ferric-dicitrate binding protein FerR (iron transport regulator)